MRASLKAGIAVAAVAALGAAVPASAPAAKQCLFQNAPVSKKNLFKAERSLLCLTNLHRLRAGVKPLLRDTRLAAAARAHSADMANRLYFDHTTPEGTTFDQRAAAAGYPFISLSENIAAASVNPTPLGLFYQWRNSTTGPNENMLLPGWRAGGIGIDPRFALSGGPGITGTQMFGAPTTNTKDDGLDYYANSSKCAKAKIGLIKKREARKRARKKGRKAQAKKLNVQIRELKQRVKQRCKKPRMR